MGYTREEFGLRRWPCYAEVVRLLMIISGKGISNEMFCFVSYDIDWRDFLGLWGFRYAMGVLQRIVVGIARDSYSGNDEIQFSLAANVYGNVRYYRRYVVINGFNTAKIVLDAIATAVL